MALKKIQLDAVADHVQFLISAMAQPITKSQEAALEGLKKSLSDVFNSIEGVQAEDNNSQSDETVKTIEPLKKEIETLKSAVNDSDKKVAELESKISSFSNIVKDLNEKINEIENKINEDKPTVTVKVFKGKEEVNGVELEYSEAKLPEKHFPSDSGFDGFVCFPDGFQTEEVIQPGETKKIPLGIQCEIPEGYEIQVRPRSGKAGDRINVGWGTVDSNEVIKIPLFNASTKPYIVKQGDKICQLVIGEVIPAKFTFLEMENN